MTVVPPLTPVTMPVDGSTVATEVLLLFQVPPVVLLLSVVVAPGQTVVVPLIGAVLITVMYVELKPIPQLLYAAYTIATEPALAPPTVPVKLTVAMLPFVLYQNPPGVASLSAAVLPVHSVLTPDIGAIVGTVITVTVAVAVIPPPVVYDIVTVPPATPVTIPEDEPTVAMVMSELLHTPPLAVSLSVVVEPAQINIVPVIGDIGCTFIVAVTTDEPQPFVMV